MHSFLSASTRHTAKARKYAITILLFRKMRLKDLQSLTGAAQPLRGQAGLCSHVGLHPRSLLEDSVFSQLKHFLATKPLMCFDKLLLSPFHIISFTSEPETSLFRPNASGLDATGHRHSVVCLPLLYTYLGVLNRAGEALSLTGFC